MFDGAIDFLGIAAGQAEAVGLADRARFLPVLARVDAALAAQAAPDVIVGGDVATAMMRFAAAGPPPLDLYHYTLYAAAPLKAGLALGRAIYGVDPEGLTMHTRVHPFSASNVVVFVEQRPLVTIVGLPRHRGVHIFTMLAPDARPSLFGAASVPCMPPEVQLIDICQRLASPRFASQWPDLLAAERDVRRVMLSGFAAKVGDIFTAAAATGGREAPRRSYADIRRSLLARIRADFVERAGVIVVSGLRVGGRLIGTRVGCVTPESLPGVRQRLERIAAAERTDVHVLVNSPQLVGDPRMLRLTAYLNVPGHPREAVLDVYNVAEYDAVPFARLAGGAVVGTLPMLERFVLVELWTMQLLWRMGSINDAFAMGQMRRIADDLRAVGAAVDRAAAGGGAGDTDVPLFPLDEDDFIGRIEDVALAEKRNDILARAQRRADGRRRLFPTYPGRQKHGGDA